MNSDRSNPEGGEHSPRHGQPIHPVSANDSKPKGICRVEPMTINGVVIPRRAADGYYDATTICNTCSASLTSYMLEERTGEMLAAIESQHNIPFDCIVQHEEVGEAGEPAGRQVWIHAALAHDLAQWCSPRYAVEYCGTVFDFFKSRIATNSIPDCPPDISDLMKIVTDGIAQGMRRDAGRN